MKMIKKQVLSSTPNLEKKIVCDKQVLKAVRKISKLNLLSKYDGMIRFRKYDSQMNTGEEHIANIKHRLSKKDINKVKRLLLNPTCYKNGEFLNQRNTYVLKGKFGKNKKLPYLDRLVYLIGGDLNNEVLKFEAKELDVISLQGSKVARYKSLEPHSDFKLYNESGFKKLEDLKSFIGYIKDKEAVVTEVKKQKQKENAPLLFNLAEIQNECTKVFKIKPDETLEIIQNLYEKKLVTYPRTDARVLSTAVAKEITKNLNGISRGCKDEEIQNNKFYISLPYLP